MTIRCLAIDDEPLALNKMAGYISKTPFFGTGRGMQIGL